jgi:hypothetical protein
VAREDRRGGRWTPRCPEVGALSAATCDGTRVEFPAPLGPCAFNTMNPVFGKTPVLAPSGGHKALADRIVHPCETVKFGFIPSLTKWSPIQDLRRLTQQGKRILTTALEYTNPGGAKTGAP